MGAVEDGLMMTLYEALEVPWQGFEAWLLGFEATAMVAYACNAGCCPVSVYLSACAGSEVAVDGSGRAWLIVRRQDRWPDYKVIPGWMRAFIEEVDGGGQRELEAHECLAILRRVMEERLDLRPRKQPRVWGSSWS